MKIITNLVLGFIFINACFCITAFAQSKNEPIDYPIVFGKNDDNFPDKMNISGSIEDLTFAGTGCGVFSAAGTLKIKLNLNIQDYPYEYVYLVNTCFGQFGEFGRKKNKYIGKKINLEVSKLLENNQGKSKSGCNFDLIDNSINSNGIPFYCASNNISKAIKDYKIGQ